MIATVVWCSFSSELCSVNSCWGVIGWSQGIRAPARPLWRTCQIHKVAWLHDFHENVILCLWVPGPLQTATERHTQVICILMSLGLPCGRVLWRASRVASPALFVHGSWLKYRERKAACLEMVPTLYFSVLTRDKIIIFGHKFLAMPKKAYVSPSGVHSFTSHQAGFSPSSSPGKQQENSFSTNQSRLDQYVVFSLLNFRNRRTNNFTNQIHSNTCGKWTAGSFTEPEKHISSAHVHFFHLETKPSSGLDQWRCSLGARPLAMLARWARSTLTALLARSQLELWSLAMLARWARSTTMHGARSLAMLQPGLDQWIAGRHRPSLADQQFCRSHHRVAPRCWLPRLPPRAPQMTPLGSMALQGWQMKTGPTMLSIQQLFHLSTR